MHQEKMKIFIEKLKNIINNVSAPTKKGERCQSFFLSDGVAFTLCDEYAVEYNNLLKDLLRQGAWGEKFSESYISNHIRDVIVKTIKDEKLDNLTAYFEELINGLDGYSQEQVVLVPVANVVMVGGVLPIGYIILKRIDDKRIDELMGRIALVINASELSGEEKKNRIQMARKVFLSPINGKVCAEYKVVAEPRRAKELAEEELRRALDLFRFSMPALYHDSLNCLIGLEGEIIQGSRSTLIISSDAKSFSAPSELVGALQPFELSPGNVDIMKGIGVFGLSDILKKVETTEFERFLLHGIHWYSDSIMQIKLENKLTSLMSCLETLLNPKESLSSITSAIAEGVALICAKETESRIKIDKRIKELYRKRSALSHGGEKEILSADIEELRMLAHAFLRNMIDKLGEFKVQSDLFEWIKILKYS